MVRVRVRIDRSSIGAPFVVAFIILLTVAAGYLAVGEEALANKLAEYAYYSLVVGVALQLASLALGSSRRGSGG